MHVFPFGLDVNSNALVDGVDKLARGHGPLGLNPKIKGPNKSIQPNGPVLTNLHLQEGRRNKEGSHHPSLWGL